MAFTLNFSKDVYFNVYIVKIVFDKVKSEEVAIKL